jgi:hypothetical protein
VSEVAHIDDLERSSRLYLRRSIAGFEVPLSEGHYDDVHFNLACVESLAGRTDAAFEHLREAVARGDERMHRLARTDDDLAPLRDDPRFEELLR